MAAAAIVFLVTIVCRGRRWVSRDAVKIMGFYGVSGLVSILLNIAHVSYVHI